MFLFKQKTAYEVRISDWSSACALPILVRYRAGRAGNARGRDRHRRALCDHPRRPVRSAPGRDAGDGRDQGRRASAGRQAANIRLDPLNQRKRRPGTIPSPPKGRPPERRKSEEHTSELQSLMRISYAVFCLKKKTNKNKTQR